MMKELFFEWHENSFYILCRIVSRPAEGSCSGGRQLVYKPADHLLITAVLACRVPVAARAAVGPLTFGPGNRVRARPKPESDGDSTPDPNGGD